MNALYTLMCDFSDRVKRNKSKQILRRRLIHWRDKKTKDWKNRTFLLLWREVKQDTYGTYKIYFSGFKSTRFSNGLKMRL